MTFLSSFDVEWIIYAVFAAILAGLVPSFLKLGSQKIAPSFSAFVFSFLYCLFLAVILVIRKEYVSFSTLNKEAIIRFVSLGTITAVSYITFAGALAHGGISKVIPLLLFRNIVYFGIDLYFASKTPSKLQLCAAIILTLGILLLESGKSKRSHAIWLLLALLSLTTLILNDVLLEKVWTETLFTSQAGAFIINLIASIILLFISVLGKAFKQPGKLMLQNWTFLLLSGVSYGLSYLFTQKASLTGNPLYLKPISSLWFPVAMIGARIVHKEEFPVGALCGILLIILGNFALMLF